MTAREIVVKIVDEVEVARTSDTAYLTVEDLKSRIEQALVEFAAQCVAEVKGIAFAHMSDEEYRAFEKKVEALIPKSSQGRKA